MGEDRHNPPEEVVRHMAHDNYYRMLLYVGILLLFASFFAVAWFLGTYRVPWWAYTVLTLGTGFQNSGAILLGHELGHKNNRADRIAAQVANGLVGYGHFCIEHNVGHHVHVATPEDCASARMGESIYKFVRREIPGAFKRGWRHERERLAKFGYGPFTWRNPILLSWMLTLAVGGALIAAVRLDPSAVFDHSPCIRLVWTDAGKLCRALRSHAAENAEWPLRSLQAAAFLEYQSHFLQLADLPSATPFGSSRQRTAPLSDPARLRRFTALAERLSGFVRARSFSIAVVQGNGPEAHALGGRGHQQTQR